MMMSAMTSWSDVCCGDWLISTLVLTETELEPFGVFGLSKILIKM